MARVRLKYECWTDGVAVGFSRTDASGVTHFVYLNPSSEDSEGAPNVFLYAGTAGDPAKDEALTHWNFPGKVPSAEKEITAYVNVSIPVGLVFDHEPTQTEIRDAALENFMDHPALRNKSDLDGYVDKIQTEDSISIGDDHAEEGEI